MNKKVYIMDNVFDGHHIAYMNVLEKIKIVNNISKAIKLETNKTKIVKYISQRQNILKYGLKKINDGDVLHLLYLDPIYMLGPIFRKSKNKKIIATLHHYPQNNIKERLFKICSKNIDTIIVHSEYLMYQLKNIGINNVEVIDYPVFNEYETEDNEKIKIEFGLNPNKYIISALGGTRYDKGLDILLEAFKYIDYKIKDQIQLNICGKEEDIKKDYIMNKCKKLNIMCRLKLDYITDEEFYKNIKISDSIVIPYRKIFTGNSGPMTEGIYQNKPIIAPNQGNLGYLMNQYNLGITFESENARDLAIAIERLITKGWKFNEKSNLYRDKLKLDTFIKKHEAIYNKYTK